jgi:hypothetical protein
MSDSSRSFRPRFSLVTALLVMALVACGLAIWRMGRETVPLREEVRHLRDLTGRLTVDDPSRVHAVRAQSTEPDFWRWRVHVPSSKTFYLHISRAPVPKDGLPPRPFAAGGMPMRPAEYFIELKFLPAEPENGKDKLTARFVWHSTDGYTGGDTAELTEGQLDWIRNDKTGQRNATWPQTLLQTVSVGPGEPLVLLRYRAHRADGQLIDGPCDGLLVWIDEVEH